MIYDNTNILNKNEDQILFDIFYGFRDILRYFVDAKDFCKIKVPGLNT